MAARSKALLKHAKGKKKKEQTLNDADDYLAAGVDNEDAMGKHRAGDPIKSIRFGRRAIELYTQGLTHWPRNFDLAYNKARLELEIATHPLLVKSLDAPLVAVLRQSLASHRYALGLDPDNADALFNSAQVLTSIAENVAKDDTVSDVEALQCLEQALDYQGRSFQLQQEKLSESHRIREQIVTSFQDDIDDGGAKVDASTTTVYEDREEEEQWVSVIEPITAESLLDTLLAQLNTLTTLCSIVNFMISTAAGAPPISLSWIESYSTKLLDGMLSTLTSANDKELAPRSAEVALAKAVFAGNLLELAFRCSSIDAEAYKVHLDAAFSATALNLTSSEDNLLAFSRALISFNGALADAARNVSDHDIHSQATIRWNALSKAQKLLITAAGLPSTRSVTEILATTHMLRGDTSLLLVALAYPPTTFPQAQSNTTQLLKNAEVFYRNASKLSGSLGGDAQDEKETAEFRGAVVTVLQTTTVNQTSGSASDTAAESTASKVSAKNILKNASLSKDDVWRREQLQDMIDEGLVRSEEFS